MKISAICTDIDGTLLDDNKELSSRTIAAFKNLDNNIPVILASARMPAAMRHIQDELGILHYPLICFNGSYDVIYENGNAQPHVIDSRSISISVCSSILNLIKGKDIHMSLYHENNWYTPEHDPYTEREVKTTKIAPTMADLTGVLNDWQRDNIGGAHKVMCMGPEEQIQALEKLLTQSFADQLHIYRSKSICIEMSPISVSKASALELILKRTYNIDMAEVMAFGDNYNDVTMIQLAGIGIAVGNAREEVKVVAKEVTARSTDDGVAITLEKYFL